MQTHTASTTPGGFVWWYADLRSGSGEGLVIIWSLGLPFLPGARGRAPACTRPSLSVAHYSGGEQRLYLLQEYGEDEADLDLSSGTGTIGSSEFRVSEDGDEIALHIALNEPMPNTSDRLQGQVTVRGPKVHLDSARTGATHVWSPQTLHASGKAHLNYAGDEHQLDGEAYFDSNVSHVPLHEQGIASWRWGRISFPDYTLVYYEIEDQDGSPQRFLYRQNSDGAFIPETGRLHFSGFESGTYGLNSPTEAFIATRNNSVFVKQSHEVEDGPFYQRALIHARDAQGARGWGVSEVVVPEKVDRPWQRPLVRMRTHRVGKDNSVFLPLFNGPRGGRATRLIYSFIGSKVSA